jgi:hypothetical protein
MGKEPIVVCAPRAAENEESAASTSLNMVLTVSPAASPP